MEAPPNTNTNYFPPDHSPEPDHPTSATNKEKYAQLSQRGRKCLAVGLLMMGLSFVINLLIFNADGDFRTVMYVTTTAGSVMILYGAACILGF